MATTKTSGTSSKKKSSRAPKTAKNNPQITGSKKKANGKIQVVSSELSYDGPLFQVFTDKIVENGKPVQRDVVRHNGSVVILAIDDSKSKRDPLVVMERQYRHAARQYLLEVPAGKLEQGEVALAGAKRELLEETGFQAKRWRKMVRYFASPGFVAEWMQVFLAEGLTAGKATPEYDEDIDVRMIPLSELLRMIEQGRIHDGKTLVSILLYQHMRSRRASAARKKK